MMPLSAASGLTTEFAHRQFQAPVQHTFECAAGFHFDATTVLGTDGCKGCLLLGGHRPGFTRTRIRRTPGHPPVQSPTLCKSENRDASPADACCDNQRASHLRHQVS